MGFKATGCTVPCIVPLMAREWQDESLHLVLRASSIHPPTYPLQLRTVFDGDEVQRRCDEEGKGLWGGGWGEASCEGGIWGEV